LAPDLLTEKITGLLSVAENNLDLSSSSVRAIMVPHAGYDYSGSVAASAYKRIQDRNYSRIILMSNAHNEAFSGIAIDDNDFWQMPLGTVETDRELMDNLVKEDYINYNSKAHMEDHTLEVQVPWLQTVLEPGFKIVPLMFGSISQTEKDRFSQLLLSSITNNDLIVVSTDLSHYPPYETAKEYDAITLDNIVNLDNTNLNKFVAENKGNETGIDTLCCGIDAVNTIISIASSSNWQAELLSYANSGDSPIGRKERVVGYGAVVFHTSLSNVILSEAKNPENDAIIPRSFASAQDDKIEKKMLNQSQKNKLLSIVKNTVEDYVKNNSIPEFKIEDTRLLEKQGAFVTLHKNGKLRGCIGQIEPSDAPLWQVVRDMAISASTEDPRFSSLSVEELDDIEYEVSVLSSPETIDDWRNIVLGEHGVIVAKGFRKGVFLPQVATETGWDLEQFLGELCENKAGLAREAYKNDPDLVIKVFKAEVFS
jgi:AmmeMemoRadiSam system protein B/AmmeMemoRadiSam system protein A